ncbi:VVA0879 family protein [Streptomyces sp. NPDC005385]|uniref:VVA0879 family protein n=1 Tax=Streptomyces sp. NPDC005385 TaxID=3157039 RepID=UPI0033B01FDA
MSSDSRTLTQDELWAEATARFGDDPLKWAFQCPTCKDIATGQDFKKVLDGNRDGEHLKRRGRPVIWSDVLGRECIGRHPGAQNWDGSSRGCKTVAYGLFSGPWFVTSPDSDHEMPFFALAPASARAGAGTTAVKPEAPRAGGEGS